MAAAGRDNGAVAVNSRGPAVDDEKTRGIVAAARELFGQVGYDKTGIRDIAKRADVAVTTVYARFPEGKAAILEVVMLDLVQRLVEHVMATPDQEPVEKFLDQVRRLNRELVSDPLLRKLRSEQGRIPEPRLRERGRQIEEKFHSAAVAQLRDLDAAGLIRCADPEAVAALLRITTRGWLQARDDGRELVGHDRVLEALLDSVRALVAVPEAPENGDRPPSAKNSQRTR